MGDIKLTEAHGIRGAFNYNWNPLWPSSLFGSHSAMRYNGTVGDLTTAKGQYCEFLIAAVTTGRDEGGVQSRLSGVAVALQHGIDQPENVVLDEAVGFRPQIGGAPFFGLVADDADIVLSRLPDFGRHLGSLRGGVNRSTMRDPWKTRSKFSAPYEYRSRRGLSFCAASAAADPPRIRIIDPGP
jgi:hypothetical protein